MNNLTKTAAFNVLTFSATILFPWSRKWQRTSVFLPGESHGRKSLAGYSPPACKESDTTEKLTPPYLDSKPITSTLGMREYGDIISVGPTPIWHQEQEIPSRLLFIEQYNIHMHSVKPGPGRIPQESQ